MSLETGVLIIGGFILLSLFRVPIFISLSLPPILYIVANGIPLILVAQRVTRMLDSFTVLAIPLFIFVGALMVEGGITDRIFRFANDVIGHLHGGLAQVNIIASLIFSGVSGSALADIGGIGRILIHSMENEGYDKGYAAALTSASATVGPIFPPSIPLIIYGLIAKVSDLSLLIAGILPGILITGVLMIGTYYLARTHDFPRQDRTPLKEVAESFIRALPALLAPVVLIAGMLLGFFGPSETAAVTVLYVVVINTVVYRETDPRYIWISSVQSAQTSAVILLILASAGLFSWVIAYENVSTVFESLVFAASTNPIVLLLITNAILLLLGLFLEPLAAMIMMVPIVLPPLVRAGVDPVHVGLIVVFNLMIGLLTPPLGLSVFVASDIAGRQPEEIFSKMRPYYVLLIACLLVVTFVPELSLLIPRMT